MSVGASGTVGSLAGMPLQQTRSSDVETTQQAARDQSRRSETARAAEAAAGVGETEEDHETEERDADGRRLWEREASTKAPAEEQGAALEDPGMSRDETGERGLNLDLCG